MCRPKPITGWRLWLFRIIALTIIPVLLLLVELSPRVAGYGYPAAAITAGSRAGIYQSGTDTFPPEQS